MMGDFTGRSLGRYQVVKKIGAGALGEVYLAEDPLLDRMVALRVLRPEITSDPDRLERFVKETKAASALDHPGVAHIYEITEMSGTHFTVMQYVEGQTLDEHIKSQPLVLQEVIDLAIQIADALEEAHSRGILHRDINPQNIMVTSRGQIKILDFGVPASLNPEMDSESGNRSDTLQFTSPEQVRNIPPDHRSDLYSFGVVLYEMVTGSLPFPGESSREILQRIAQEPPEPVLRLNPSAPRELEQIILKCLEKDPNQRYQDATHLLRDLRTLKDKSESRKTTIPLPLAPARTFVPQWVTILLTLAALLAILFVVLPGKSHSIRSLAVLPFVNADSDSSTEYLSDGITDEIINKLSRIPNLKVLSHGSVFRYKGKEVDPRQVGKELDVDAIVAGRVFQQGDDLRIQVSLVRSSDGAQIWGQQYNRRMSDIMTMQTEISREISELLPQKLTGEVAKQIEKDPTANVEAYQLYLRGRFYLNKRTREDFQRGIYSFQEAIALDPNYALAYAGLADGFTLLCNWGFLPARDGFPRAKEAAQKALSLDSTLAEAHTSLAIITAVYDWNWKEAEYGYLKAIELNPNYSTARQWYGLYLTLVGRTDEAMTQIREAQRLDPLSLITRANAGYSLYFARKYDEAIRELDKTIELDPNFALTYQILGYVHGLKGDYANSILALEKAVALAPDNLTFEADLAWATASSGEKQKAEKMLDQLLRISITTYLPPFHIAGIYIGLNENNKALDWLEKAYEEHSDQITYIGMDPRFDPIRNDPRFETLLRKIGLDDLRLQSLQSPI